MARNAAGNMSLSPGPFAIPNTIPISAQINLYLDDLCNEITDSLSRSGKGGMLASLDMNSFRIIDVGDGIADTDAVNLRQVKARIIAQASTVDGTADAITLTFVPPYTAYTTGMQFSWVASGPNTITNPTVNVDGLGDKTITKYGGQPLAVGDIVGAGTICIGNYNGTTVELLNPRNAVTDYTPTGQYIDLREDALGFTLAADDKGKLIAGNFSAADAIVVPANADVAIPVKSWFRLWQKNVGQVNIVAGTGVTIRSKSDYHALAAKGSEAELVKVAADEWFLFGDLAALSGSGESATDFPAIVPGSPTSGSSSTLVSSVALTIPTGGAVGNTLIGIIAWDDATRTPTWPAGWTEFGRQVNNQGVTMGWRTTDGSEGASATVTFSGTTRHAWQCYRIQGGVTPPERSLSSEVATTNPNPPSITPSWGSAKNLYMAGYGMEGGIAPSGYPTGYDLNQTSTIASGSEISLATASRQLEAGAEDPGVFTHVADDHIPFTIVMKASPPTTDVPVILATKTNSNFGANNTKSFSHTVDAGTDKLVVLVHWGQSAALAVASVTYGGVSMTERADILASGGGSQKNGLSYYTLDNPTVGTADVIVVLTGSCDDGGITALNLDNVKAGAATNSQQSISNSGTGNVTQRGPITVTSTQKALVLWLAGTGGGSNLALSGTGLTALHTGGSNGPDWNFSTETLAAAGSTPSRTASCSGSTMALLALTFTST